MLSDAERDELTKKYVNELQKRCFSGDLETDHVYADNILMDLLTELRLNRIVEVYDSIDKWYA